MNIAEGGVEAPQSFAEEEKSDLIASSRNRGTFLTVFYKNIVKGLIFSRLRQFFYNFFVDKGFFCMFAE